MITVRLDPADEARLNDLASRRGETAEETARSLLRDQLLAMDWPEDREEDVAEASVSMASKFLPPEDWSEDAPEGGDGSR